MDALLQQIGLTTPEGQQLAILGLVFVAVFVAVLGLALVVNGRDALRRRLGTGAPAAGAVVAGGADPVRLLDGMANVGRVFRPLGKHLIPTNLAEVSAVRRRLVQAGYLQPSAVGRYYVIRVALAVLLPSAFLLVAPLVSGRTGVAGLIALGSALGVIGSYAPSLWITLRTRSLQRRYREAFPDALDLLVVCVEAGLALDSAINRVGQELGGAHGALGDQFRLMALELRAGKSRQDALRNLSERLGLEEVRAMVTLLLQSEELGTSIADALRVYSDEMRAQRMLRAEAKAMALPVKLAIPLALFIFPVMMIVIMLPVVIRIKNQLLTVEFG